jgi:predicted transposase/invertase (TIGR01784 family)
MPDEATHSLHQPHDKLFKSLLSHTETAMALINFVHPKVTDIIEPDTLEIANTSFISDYPQHYFADVIFSAKTNDGRALRIEKEQSATACLNCAASR